MSRVLRAALLLLVCLSGAHAAGESRSKVQFAAISSGTRVFPWPSLDKPLITFPFNEKNRPEGLAVFKGNPVWDDERATAVEGGTLLVETKNGKDIVVRNAWAFELIEVGLVDLSGQGNDDIYFVSRGGGDYEIRNFYLYNPKKAALMGLSYSWGHDDKKPQRHISDTYTWPELRAERDFLKDVSKSDIYQVPQ